MITGLTTTDDPSPTARETSRLFVESHHDRTLVFVLMENRDGTNYFVLVVIKVCTAKNSKFYLLQSTVQDA
jgi:hypothetical protein